MSLGLGLGQGGPVVDWYGDGNGDVEGWVWLVILFVGIFVLIIEISIVGESVWDYEVQILRDRKLSAMIV